MEVKYTGPGPCAGENGTRALTVAVEPAYRTYTVRLAFASPAGRVYITPALTLTNGEATYPLPSCLLDSPGKLRVQAVAESGDGRIAKSEIAIFRVERSIAARAAREPETGGLISLCTLHTALTALSAAVEGKADAAHTHAYDGLTGKPTIPTVPEISTDITADAASDIKTASPKAVKTYVDAAAGGGSVTVDDEISGTSENPVQNKVIKAALDGKQDTLQYDTEPTRLSNKMLTSGKLYNAFQTKQDVLTWDDTPTADSVKPVKSGGVYTALAGKSDTGHTHAYSELTGKPTIPTISTDITADAASDLKTASPKAVKTYVDNATGGGAVAGDITFASGHSPTVTYKKVLQVGNVVYVSMGVAWDEPLGSGSMVELGKLTGVESPFGVLANDLCVTGHTGSGGGSSGWKAAMVTVASNKSVYISEHDALDDMIYLNFFYLT